MHRITCECNFSNAAQQETYNCDEIVMFLFYLHVKHVWQHWEKPTFSMRTMRFPGYFRSLAGPSNRLLLRTLARALACSRDHKLWSEHRCQDGKAYTHTHMAHTNNAATMNSCISLKRCTESLIVDDGVLTSLCDQHIVSDGWTALFFVVGWTTIPLNLNLYIFLSGAIVNPFAHWILLV